MTDVRNDHQPVFLEESVQSMLSEVNGVYVDGTFGRGGHSRFLLNCLGDNGSVWGFDKDDEAVLCGEELEKMDKRFHIVHASFAMMSDYFSPNSIDGVLLDLGVSSPQLDDIDRGFSFIKDGPLDMRMDRRNHLTAAKWIAEAKEREICEVLWQYGEERNAKRIARAIVRERDKVSIVTTGHLAEIIKQVGYIKEYRKHPATRVFQAIRIYINNELDELTEGLQKALKLLKQGGRLIVISFHSLEDRIVKRFIRQHERGDFYPKELPITESMKKKMLKRIGGAIKPSEQEVSKNKRARSAIMRVAQKI